MITFEEDKHLVEGSRGPDLTPMIDVIFLLLVFFLLTSFVILPSLDITLPEAETARVEEPPPVTITIGADESLLLNGEPVSRDALYGELRGLEPPEVLIQSDRGVSFGVVVEVMDLSRKAGAGKISFLVEPKP